MEQIFPGVWRLTLGNPEPYTPVGMRHQPVAPALEQAPAVEAPFGTGSVAGRKTRRGFEVRIPLADGEQVYGLGLQLRSHRQRGLKKTLRVNSDPTADLGDSHAPVPFYVSTAGYGVLIDTARYATFYVGCAVATGPAQNAGVLVEIPCAAGVDVYIFAGPDLRAAVSRYNLFSGGGCIPPRWGLGVWYRGLGSFADADALRVARQLREESMPCDVYGLEPGWQSRSYSCSWRWKPEKFPRPAEFVNALARLHLRVNLWTHVFASPEENPLHESLLPLSGTYEVWKGLVPDLALPRVREMIAGQHEHEHVELGVAGYKLDECDNSDFCAQSWSFPEASEFPSGLDGEQMHSLLGINYQETIEAIYRRRDRRTYGQVRSSQALAAPYPYVLYSDLYDHRDFLRGLVNAGFCGLLWSPEVRDARSSEDLVRRLQTVVLSPQALINTWYITHPPWKQWDREQNEKGVFLNDGGQLQNICREMLNFRMQLIPYLYAAFYRYHLEGLPPFRALVMDYPQDPAAQAVDTQWMVGDGLMAAPVVAGQNQREIYLPAGLWYDFRTGGRQEGGQTVTMPVPLETIPLFVRGDALIPLAEVTQHTDDPRSLDLAVRVYGSPNEPFTLYEDDDRTYGCLRQQYNRLTLEWDAARHRGAARREGTGDYPRYRIVDWREVTDGATPPASA